MQAMSERSSKDVEALSQRIDEAIKDAIREAFRDRLEPDTFRLLVDPDIQGEVWPIMAGVTERELSAVSREMRAAYLGRNLFMARMLSYFRQNRSDQGVRATNGSQSAGSR